MGTRADEIGVLTGRIIVIPHHADAPKTQNTLLTELKSEIAAAQDDAPRAVVTADDGLINRVDSILQRATLRGLTLVSADYHLFRTGEFRLSIEEQGDREFSKLLASQMYYFAKDISHRHYHHPTAQDNLLPLTEAGHEDESWRRETLWSLTRAVLEKRRTGRLPEYKSAMGILAYAEAFQGLLARVRRGGLFGPFTRTKNVAFYDFAHTRLSLEAAIEEKGFRTSMGMQVQGMAIAVTLGAMALWIAALQVKDMVCDTPSAGCGAIPPPIVGDAIARTVSEPWIPLFMLVVLGSVYVEWSRRSLEVMRPYASWAVFLGDWLDAIGASASKAVRRIAPDWGDKVGAAVAWSFTTTLVVGAFTALGALTRLWPWPPAAAIWLWTGSIALFSLVALIVRKTFWRQ